MKIGPAVAILVVCATIAACGGYWLGFREAWGMGIRADAAPKGVIAIGNLRLIESGRTNDLKFALESEIDTGLMLWHDLSASPLRPVMNPLSGIEIFPDYEQYVRKLAAYRKANKSPLSDPKLTESLISNARKHDPALARELEQSKHSAERAIDEVVKKYAP
jgi:hypothetical protein